MDRDVCILVARGGLFLFMLYSLISKIYNSALHDSLFILQYLQTNSIYIYI